MKSGMLGGGSQGRRQRTVVGPAAEPTGAPTVMGHSWRHDVLDAMLRVAALVGPILVVLAMVFRRGPHLDVVSALMVGSVGLLVVLRFLPRLPFRSRAALAIAVLYTAGLPALVRSGFAMGSAAAMAAAIVLAVVLLGRGPAFLLLVATAAVMGALGAAAGAGHFVPRAIDSNPDIPANWFRMGITFDSVAAMLMVAVEFAVLHIEKNYLEAAAALERLTEEQRRRAGLERERRAAELGWQRCAQELIALGKHPAVEAGDLAVAFAAITEAGARGLDVERCSVWLLDDTRGEIGCQDLYERAPARHSSGQRLESGQAPAYFAALEAERAIAAHDARRDPRTRELSAGYLESLGITSMLDAPIRFRDRVVGVVCHEHTGAALTWSEAQQSFAGSLADFAARVLAAADWRAKERALRTVNTELGQLNRRLESAKEDERRFIARELHDELGQTLTALKLRLKMGARAADPERAERESAATFAMIDSLIDWVRKLSLDSAAGSARRGWPHPGVARLPRRAVRHLGGGDGAGRLGLRGPRLAGERDCLLSDRAGGGHQRAAPRGGASGLGAPRAADGSVADRRHGRRPRDCPRSGLRRRGAGAHGHRRHARARPRPRRRLRDRVEAGGGDGGAGHLADRTLVARLGRASPPGGPIGARLARRRRLVPARQTLGGLARRLLGHDRRPLVLCFTHIGFGLPFV